LQIAPTRITSFLIAVHGSLTWSLSILASGVALRKNIRPELLKRRKILRLICDWITRDLSPKFKFLG
jgi:hypothetical protein